jgi:serine/threonine protein kinase
MLSDADIAAALASVGLNHSGSVEGEIDSSKVRLDPAAVPLDSGSFADVFAGEIDTASGPLEVAVKAFRGTSSAAAAAGDSAVLRELQVSVDNSTGPNLVRTYGAVRIERFGLCLVMQLMRGRSLRRVLDNDGVLGNVISRGDGGDGGGGGLPWTLRTTWLEQIAGAMAHLHGQGVAHRDLRAANVLLDHADPAHAAAYVADFGLATVMDKLRGGGRMTYTQGAVEWSAPETFQPGQRELSATADVYSYGVLMYEVLTRRLPFYGLTQQQRHKVQLQNIAANEFEFDEDLLEEAGLDEAKQRAMWQKKAAKTLVSRRPDTGAGSLAADCPEPLVALMRRCWDDNPTSRPTFAEICTELSHERDSSGEETV